MNEILQPTEHNPNAANPPGEKVQNLTVDATEFTQQNATLPDGTQITWGKPPIEQQSQQQKSVTYFGDSYNNQSIEDAKKDLAAQNAAPGTAQVTQIGGLDVTGKIHRLPPSGPYPGVEKQGIVDPYDLDFPEDWGKGINAGIPAGEQQSTIITPSQPDRVIKPGSSIPTEDQDSAQVLSQKPLDVAPTVTPQTIIADGNGSEQSGSHVVATATVTPESALNQPVSPAQEVRDAQDDTK